VASSGMGRLQLLPPYCRSLSTVGPRVGRNVPIRFLRHAAAAVTTPSRARGTLCPSWYI